MMKRVAENLTERRAALRVLIAGALGMVIAMGIGRFAFTPILPLMQRELGMSNALAGQLAGLNYLGYLLGALACSFVPRLVRVRGSYPLFLITSLLTTGFMGLFVSEVWWALLRFASGVASAMLFLYIATEALQQLTHRGYARWAGALHGGVGLGIALSGLLVPQLSRFTDWAGAWSGMGVLALFMALVATLLSRGVPPMPEPASTTSSVAPPGRTPIGRLGIAYFFEGLGYVIAGTFLVTIIAATEGLEAIAPYSWVVVGVAAAPSTLFWPAMARRFGTRQALLGAYGLQLTGAVVSLWAQSVPAVLFIAFAFGGTFLGIVTLSVNEGIRRARHDKARIASILTLCFGVGQLIGPPVAGWFADRTQSFTASLIMAAVAIVVAVAFTLWDREFESR